MSNEKNRYALLTIQQEIAQEEKIRNILIISILVLTIVSGLLLIFKQKQLKYKNEIFRLQKLANELRFVLITSTAEIRPLADALTANEAYASGYAHLYGNLVLTDTWTYSASYTLTQADIDAGKVEMGESTRITGFGLHQPSGLLKIMNAPPAMSAKPASWLGPGVCPNSAQATSTKPPRDRTS